MKRKRFSVEQIVAVLKQAELGMAVSDLTRRMGISEQTFYRWKKAIRGPSVGSGAGAQTAAGREYALEEARGGFEPR